MGGFTGALGSLLGSLGLGGASGGNMSQATNPFAIAAGAAGAAQQQQSIKWLQNALATVWANNNNANNLGTQGFQSQAGTINPLAQNLTGQGSQLTSSLAPLLQAMQQYQGNIPGLYSSSIANGLSPAMLQALSGMQGTANTQTPAINAALGIIGKQGQTPLSQYFSTRGMQLAGTNPLLSTPEAAAIAGNQAATNFKAQQKQAMAQALARGGGAGSQTFGGSAAEGLADISDMGQQTVSNAFQQALLNQQGLGLQQQAQGTNMGATGGSLANTQLGLGSGLLNNAANTQGNLLSQILSGNLAGGQFGLSQANSINSALQNTMGQQSNLGQAGIGAQGTGLNSLAQILSGYGNILNSATGAAPGIFAHFTPQNAWADYLKSLARSGAPSNTTNNNSGGVSNGSSNGQSVGMGTNNPIPTPPFIPGGLPPAPNVSGDSTQGTGSAVFNPGAPPDTSGLTYGGQIPGALSGYGDSGQIVPGNGNPQNNGNLVGDGGNGSAPVDYSGGTT